MVEEAKITDAKSTVTPKLKMVPKGIELSETLKPSGDKSMSTLYLEINENGNNNVVLTGLWNGTLVRGALRAVEQKYKQIKAGAKREALAKQTKEANNVTGTK